MNRIIASLLLLIPLSVSARTGIYLIPEVETDKTGIILSDIAGIDGDQIVSTGAVPIPQSMYKDMIIDRKELNDYLTEVLKVNYTVFGNGVKLTFKKASSDIIKEEEEEKVVLVKKGENVELLVRNRGISIEVRGRAMQSGTVDDEIDVRLKNGKVFRGKPFAAGKVAVCL